MFAHTSLTCLRYQILEVTKESLLVGLLQCDKQKLSLTWTPAWTWETELESSLIILGQKCNAIHFWALPFPDLLLHFARVQLLYCNRSTSKLWQLIRKPQKKAYDGKPRVVGESPGLPWERDILLKHGSVSCALRASLCQVLFDSVFQGDAVPDSDLLADHHPAVLHCVCNQR